MTRQRDPGQWWTEAWSPVTGCTPAGAGCDHCWARVMVRRFPALHGCTATMDHPKHGPIGAAPAPFSTVRCHPDRLDKPLHWRKPRVVLVSMLGDLFHEQVPARFINDTFDAIRVAAHGHRFHILTKRFWRVAGFSESLDMCPRAMVMASVWDQPSADAACAAFALLPAGVRWGLHVEPMLGAIDMRKAQPRVADRLPSWICCGGENGPSARPMDPQWAIDLREQCAAAGVPFWFKGGSRFSPEMSNEERSGLESSRETPW